MSFNIESDAAFAGLVDPAAAGLLLPGVPGAGSNGAPYTLPQGSLSLLLAGGRATAAISSPSKALFLVSSTWAILRWFWAFNWGGVAVTLSPTAAQIRNHHRQAFSEILGLGAGLLVTEYLAGGPAMPPGAWSGGPLLVDVDSHIPAGTRPDLVIFNGPPGPGTATYVLECKGNRTGRPTSIGQLADGIHQTLALGGPATRLVVGVAATGPGFEAFAITVPPGAAPPAIAGQKGAAAAPVSLAQFGNTVLDHERSRLLRFAGEDDLIFATPPERLEVSEAGVEITGRRFRLRGDHAKVELTVGVETDVLERTRAAEAPEELAEIRAATVERSRRRYAETAERVPLFDAGQAVETAEDGCVLSARVQ